MHYEYESFEDELCSHSEEDEQSRAGIRVIILSFTLVFFLLLGLLMQSCTPGESQPAGTEISSEPKLTTISDTPMTEEMAAEQNRLSLSPADLNAIPAAKKLTAYALEDTEGRSNKAPELTEKQRNAINSAIEDIQQFGNLSMVFFNANTGKGYSFAPDKTVYGASSLKGPYAVYVCQQFVDPGKARLSDSVPLYSTNEGSIPVDTSEVWISLNADGTASVKDLITSSVVNSDNAAFGMLRNEYDTKGWNKWAQKLTVKDTPHDPTSWYAWYCARSSAKFWLNALEYFEGETKTSAWLKPLFEQTTVSFLRDGIKNTDTTVMNKAGWCAGGGADFDSTCDAGIIVLDGQTYIMSIMTSMPDSSTSRECVSALAKALFNARETLC